jgi:hypothetical protein
MTPGGDANDPYAKGRRPPQQSGRHSIDPRFIFTKKKKQHGDRLVFLERVRATTLPANGVCPPLNTMVMVTISTEAMAQWQI